MLQRQRYYYIFVQGSNIHKGDATINKEEDELYKKR